MKHQQAPKWLLTTALLAVLGAQYSFQTSSLSMNENSGLFELSSEVSNGRESRTTTAKSRVSTQQSQAVSKTESKAEKTNKTSEEAKKQVHIKREGQVVASGTCADEGCKNVLLSMETLEKFVSGLQTVASATAPASPTSTVASSQMSKATTEEVDEECDFTEDGKPETRVQKRDRIRCEKDRKNREKQEELLAKFEDKMEDVKDKCEVATSESKLECVTREFNNALSRYSGRNSISPAVAQRYFKQIVGSELTKSLFNSDKSPEEMISVLQDIFDGLPSEFSGLRKSVLDAIQNQTRAKAAIVHQQFKSAETMKNNPEAYLQTVGEAQQQQAELSQMAEVYSAAARTSDSFSTDGSFMSYYQASYMPSMRKIFASINSSAGVEGARESIENSTRTRTRSTISTNAELTAPSVPAASKLNESSSQWNFLNSTSGVNMGTPSNTSRGNTRGARSMGM